eukprot:gene21458-biopygen1063
MASENNQEIEGSDTQTLLMALESSISKIQDTLNQALATQSSGHSQASAAGTSSVSHQGGQSDFSLPPSFLRVAPPALPASASAAEEIHPISGPAASHTQSPAPQPRNLAALPWFLEPQQWLSLPSSQAVSVMGGLPPVPGYLASLIEKNEFIDFSLLRLCNISRLPTMSPSSAQLERLLKTLQPIATFVDWAEAWAVFASVVLKFSPDKLPSLLAYFLVVAKAHRDIPGMGWLAYDAAFRKQAANNASLSWAVLDPTLYISTVLTSGVHHTSQAHKPQAFSGRNNVCQRWNKGICTFGRACHYVHACMVCQGDHTVRECPMTGDKLARHGDNQKRPRSLSPPPLKKSRK